MTKPKSNPVNKAAGTDANKYQDRQNSGNLKQIVGGFTLPRLRAIACFIPAGS
ncbi:MAG TPA: hypothetical protein V6D16_02840 [Candidatus Obscuribacterales bacterium]